jgi:hypothetical protein
LRDSGTRFDGMGFGEGLGAGDEVEVGSKSGVGCCRVPGDGEGAGHGCLLVDFRDRNTTWDRGGREDSLKRRPLYECENATKQSS